MIRVSLAGAFCVGLLVASVAANAQYGYPTPGYGYPQPPDPQQARCATLQQTLSDLSARIQGAPPSWQRDRAETRWHQVREIMRNECGV